MSARILVIEDDAAVRESLKDMLSLDNYDCTVAGSGREGLALAESLRPALVVTDVQLPDMSGYQLCQDLKKDPISRHIPVIMMTGRFTEPDDRLQGFELGADEFFAKPFDPVYFMARVKSILR
jgi:two-component system, cell cycle response regulator